MKSTFRTLALAALLACGAPLASAQTLRWAAQNDVLTLDPHSQNHSTTSALLQHAYEGLTRYNRTYQVEGALATDWKAITPTQIRFNLRKGVKFQDGSPFTADDVVFSFSRINSPHSTLKPFVAGITEIKKIDSHTVDFILSAPNPILTRTIIDFRIMSKAWADKNKASAPPKVSAKEETFATRNAMGTGPYKITGWQPEQRITMVQNPDWWDAKNASNVKQVLYTPIKSDQTRVAGLLSGEVDLVTDLPTQDVARLKTDAKLKVLEGNEVRTIFIAMDQGSDELRNSSVKGANPFKDKRVREAMSLAIDREAIKRSLMRGLSIPAAIMVAPVAYGWSQELDTVAKADVARAKQLMTEAGYGDGFEVPLACPNDRYVNDEEICQAVVSMWARIGLKAKLQTQPMTQHSAALQRFDLPLYMYGWGVTTFDAQYTLQDIVHTKTSGADGKGNYSRVSDAKVDALVQQMKVETDVPKRLALMQEALKRTRDEFLFIPIHHQVRPWAMKAGVTIPHSANDAPQARWATMK